MTKHLFLCAGVLLISGCGGEMDFRVGEPAKVGNTGSTEGGLRMPTIMDHVKETLRALKPYDGRARSEVLEEATSQIYAAKSNLGTNFPHYVRQVDQRIVFRCDENCTVTDKKDVR